MNRVMIVLDTLRVKCVTFTWVHTRFQIYTVGLKLVFLVRTEMTSWAGGYEPYFIFYLGILKVGFSPALNTVLCVSQQEAIAYLGATLWSKVLMKA